RWERGDANWQLQTHLDPKSNRLHEQLAHTSALRSGRGIAKVDYDHSKGTFSDPKTVDPRKNIIVQGLHSFVLEQQRKLFDLRIFMDPDEKLRYFWKLRRDSRERGHSPSQVKEALRKRSKDRLATVLPQRQHADLVFSLKPLKPAQLNPASLDKDPELYLEVTAKNSFNLETLAGRLQACQGIKVKVEYPHGLSNIRLRVDGQPQVDEIDAAVRDLVPNLTDLAGTSPRFEDGVDGLMMLVLLVCLSESLRWKSHEVLGKPSFTA
ncbi:MAG TPA: hypothetical protein VK786_04360, partial [bacterium]|nr:hypothetical protein [bacterium]